MSEKEIYNSGEAQKKQEEDEELHHKEGDGAKKQYTADELARIEEKRTISDADLLKSGARYEMDAETKEKKLISSSEQIQKINETIEDMLAEGIITQEALNHGDIEIIIEKQDDSLIEYEFELEKEQRIKVDAVNFQVLKWENHIIDTYDQSGRCRIRLKNNEPRLSLKVPLLTQDTEKAKCCIRIENKALTKKQAEEFLKIKELIESEPETKVHEKWGTPLKLNDGEKVWLNKDDQNKYWIEIDGERDIKDLLPEGITYLGHTKSKIKIEKNDQRRRQEAQASFIEKNEAFLNFWQNLSTNIETVSRSAQGISDTSVSEDKAKLDLEGEKLAEQVQKNIFGLAHYIWENKEKQFESAEDVRGFINDIANLANNKLSEKRSPHSFRTHEVPYGRKVHPDEIEKEMEMFYSALLGKIQEADRGSMDPKDLAKWIELEINRNIHPYADGCGKISNALSSFFLARYNYALPSFDSRESYYEAMNKGDEDFGEYYQALFNKEKTEL